MSSRLSRHMLLWLVLPGMAVALFAFRGGEPAGWRAPAVSLRTAEDRQQALEALRRAWQERPHEVSPAHQHAERIFLNRLAFFVRGTDGSETSVAARRLWNQCYRDHAQRYRDFLDAE